MAEETFGERRMKAKGGGPIPAAFGTSWHLPGGYASPSPLGIDHNISLRRRWILQKIYQI
jgi:hypothetical protein